MKIGLIVNPHGGLKKGRQLLERVQPEFEAADISVELYETDHQGHVQEMATDFNLIGLDALCAIGGDGTLFELLNGMLTREEADRIPIGMIPGGTGNAFLKTVNLLDPVDAAQAIIRNESTMIDAARIEMNGSVTYACNIIGWGLATDIGIRSEQFRWLGTSRYTIASVIEVLIGRKRGCRLVIDDEVFDEKFSFILGLNTQYTGNGMRMAPEASLTDGLIDLIIVRSAPRLKVLRLLPKVFDGSHMNSPLLEHRQVSSFSLHPAERGLFNIDGELVDTAELSVTMIPNAFAMLI